VSTSAQHTYSTYDVFPVYDRLFIMRRHTSVDLGLDKNYSVAICCSVYYFIKNRINS